MTSFTLENKIALITGGSRGIGAAIARGFAEQGATVIIAARKQSTIEETVAAIQASGGKASGIACHTAKATEVNALFSRIGKEFGKLDILVNNAATNPYFGPFIAAEESAFDKTFEVNVKGYFLTGQYGARMMVEQGGGSIINIASIEGLSPSPMMGLYAMTKAAVIMLTKVIARELGGFRVRCNCICPGLTETRFSRVLLETPELHEHYVNKTPLGRHALPDEIVGLPLSLVMAASPFE
ncbi:MAG: 4-formylbenzenesulfonate dehydrogenase TsaC1/TsaC2 [Candidatus Hydrogenedentes bacterium ADurb.Bin179]|nr:MAG: 4-formylbenzenesulfonate dehydrogenase TsaC1/TsaC2 [Candidatus Hydrogenedentes bacterium ADurb.Bin179]